MSKTRLILLFGILTACSCKGPLEPCIETDKDYAGVGETIEFSNCSEWTRGEYIWDFGDGNVSVSQRPQHAYDRVGTYVVKLIEHDGMYRERITHKVHVGDHVLKSIDFNFITDSEVYRTKTCDRLYFLDGSTLLASNFGDSCYSSLDYALMNTTSQKRIPVSTNPDLRFIHSFFVSADTTQPWLRDLIQDTLYIDSNLTLNFADQVVYDDVLFFGKHETFSVNLVFPLFVEHE